jgi:hypothetical protein
LHTQAEFGFFGYLWLAFMVALAARAMVLARARKKQFRHYAQSHGLNYIGAALPMSFPLDKTSVYRSGWIRNAVAGQMSGMDLLFFDCSVGTGKGRRTQTVVALRGPVERFGTLRFDPSLTTEKIGEWTLLFRPRERLAVEDIELLLLRL